MKDESLNYKYWATLAAAMGATAEPFGGIVQVNLPNVFLI
jgi:hypothetical protein